MSSYGSLCSKAFHSKGTFHGGDRNDSPTDPTENTPLLSVPDHSFFPGSGGVSVSTPPLSPHRDDDLLTITDTIDGGEEREVLPILSKIISNTPLGIEAEVIPATASAPDAHNDFRLPRDDALRYIANQNDGNNDEATEFSFRGGITTGQFWLIFTGKETLAPYVQKSRLSANESL
jgi:hypothetical protein